MDAVCLESELVPHDLAERWASRAGDRPGGNQDSWWAWCSANHKILGRAKRTTPAKEGGPAIVAAIMACVDDALEAAGLSRSEIVGAGVGSPGPLDVKTGTILFSANMNVRNFPLGAELSAGSGRPVIVRERRAGRRHAPNSGSGSGGVIAT